MEFFRIKKDILHALCAGAQRHLVAHLRAGGVLPPHPRPATCRWSSTGGTVVEVSYAQAPQLEPIREALAGEGYPDAQVQN